VAEGETQYNIPVSSKQLIVYFVFLVIALSAAFLAGVMVGRNVDSSPEPTVRDIQDGVAEEPSPSPTADALTYGSALQGDKIERLSPSPSAKTTSSPASAQAKGSPTVRTSPTVAPSRPSPSPVRSPTPAAAKSSPSPPPSPTRPRAQATPVASPTASAAQPKASPKATPLSRLTIQVGAFKERAAAEAIVKRLKAKGYSAYLVPLTEGLFNVRVGSFTDREDAERILAKLETQEKFKPFIVKP
jgi:cell division septation protein DedD